MDISGSDNGATLIRYGEDNEIMTGDLGTSGRERDVGTLAAALKSLSSQDFDEMADCENAGISQAQSEKERDLFSLRVFHCRPIQQRKVSA